MGHSAALHERHGEGGGPHGESIWGMTVTGEGAHRGDLHVDDPATRLSGGGFPASEIPSDERPRLRSCPVVPDRGGLRKGGVGGTYCTTERSPRSAQERHMIHVTGFLQSSCSKTLRIVGLPRCRTTAGGHS